MGLMGLEVESFGVLGAAAAAAAQSNDKMDTSCMSICSARLNGEFV